MRSGVFSLGRWRCYMMMLVEQARWLLWTLLIVSLALIVAGFVLSPWAGIAAVAIDAFLVVMAVSFVIMAYGFNSITGVNMPPHALQLEGDSIKVEFEDGKSVEVSRKDIRPYKIYPGGALVPVDGARAGWLWVPPAAFDTPEGFTGFMKKIYESHTE